MLRFVSASLAVLCTGTAGFAQNFLVVDPELSPGSSFKDIQSAVDAAASGDRVLVRVGTYAGFTVDKPIAIVAQTGATLTQPNAQGEAFSISNLPADSDLVIRGFQLFFFTGGGYSIVNCDGRVLIDGLSTFVSNAPTTITDAAQVLVNDSQITGGHHITRSSVTFSDCNITGFAASSVPGPGIEAIDSEVVIARSVISGGSGIPLLGPVGGPGIELSNSEVKVMGDATSSVSAGPNVLIQGDRPAVEGTGELTIDPDVVLVPLGSAPAIAATVTTTTQDMPSLSARGGLLNSTSTVSLYAEDGDTYFLLVGKPGDALPVPAWNGAIWLDLQNTGLVSTGTVGSSGVVSFTFPVLDRIVLLGLQVHWVGLAGNNSFQLTNNAGYTHGF